MADQTSTSAAQFDLSDFNHNKRNILIAAPHVYQPGENAARLLLEPFTQYRVPFLANPPRGSAFAWWGGIQGFGLTGQPTVVVHHAFGEDDSQADVVFPDELHINLAGTLAGKNAAADGRWLRKVITDPTPEDGKILVLPDLLEQVARVKVENYELTHDQGDTTDSIGYQVTFIRVGSGRKISLPPLQSISPNPRTIRKRKKGKGPKSIRATSTHKTLKTVAFLAYGDASPDSISRLMSENDQMLAKIAVPTSQLLSFEFAPGTEFVV